MREAELHATPSGFWASQACAALSRQSSSLGVQPRLSLCFVQNFFREGKALTARHAPSDSRTPDALGRKKDPIAVILGTSCPTERTIPASILPSGFLAFRA